MYSPQGRVVLTLAGLALALTACNPTTDDTATERTGADEEARRW
jgi:hypothetical protein